MKKKTMISHLGRIYEEKNISTKIKIKIYCFYKDEEH